jgi:hypothetical protein
MREDRYRRTRRRRPLDDPSPVIESPIGHLDGNHGDPVVREGRFELVIDVWAALRRRPRRDRVIDESKAPGLIAVDRPIHRALQILLDHPGHGRHFVTRK